MLLISMAIGLTACSLMPEKKDVEQNNSEASTNEEKGVFGAFVKYKNNIYYWKLNAQSRKEVGLFAEYADSETAKNELIKRDKDGNEQVITTDNGSGELFIVNNKIFYGSNNKIYSVDIDGKNKSDAIIGKIRYIVGDYIYCEQRKENANATNIIAINTKDGSSKIIVENAYIVGCIDNEIYYSKNSTDSISIGYISNLEDKDTFAAVRGNNFNDYFSESDGIKVESIIKDADNNQIVIYVGYRAGTAHMLQETVVVFFNKSENTVRISNSSNDSVDSTLVRTEDGEVFEETVNNSLTRFAYLENGQVDQTSFISKKDLEEKLNLKVDDEHYFGLYMGNKIDGDVYFIVEYSEHYPEEDIGWRYAYKRIKTYYLKYNEQNEELKVLYEF
jgi:hypothetical protein